MNWQQHCKILNFIAHSLLLWFFSFLVSLNFSESYYFWLKSADNTPENIQKIENTLNVRLPIVSFIFGPRDESDVLNSIDKIAEKLWTDRIYHFTISPDTNTANNVLLWKFDAQYLAFFKRIKEKNLHVIFRTMHEMNGWRYPWSSNPKKFKAAWIHVWNLSRVAWLDQENILFDFSVNHRDMPTKQTPSQSAKLIQCSVWKKWCFHFEDYYPWNEYVDVVWFTFYNRWKAIDNRKWLSPTQILFDKSRKTYDRIKAFKKPIIIDEVATTSVRYKGNYDFQKSRDEYLNHNERKDAWIHQLWEFIIKHPEIVATIYFNTDYTNGLNFRVTWEADWAIVDIENNKIYWWFQELEMFWEKELDDILTSLFHLKKFTIDWEDIFISQYCEEEVSMVASILDEKPQTDGERISLIKQFQKTNSKSECITRALNSLLEIYSQK